MKRSIAITGVLGNLGWKLMTYFAEYSEATRLLGLDYKTIGPEKREEIKRLASRREGEAPVIDWLSCDLTNPDESQWPQVIGEYEAIIHLAAKNPFPDATWEESSASLDMTIHTALAAVRSATTRRYVTASSNHVMGGYKEEPHISEMPPGGLKTTTPPLAGTLIHLENETQDSTPYSYAKLAAERLMRGLGHQEQGKTTFCGIRVGWCQMGENHPSTLDSSGSHKAQARQKPGQKTLPKDDWWYQSMWLSNRDLHQVFHKAVEADASAWNSGCSIVNGMSNNRDMKWSLEEGRRDLGYEPRDDAFDHIH